MDKKINPSRVTELKIADITITPGFNPRESKEDSGLLPLGKSIEKVGQIQPVIVNFKDNKYFLIAGQRRIEAARKRGLKTIEAKVFIDLNALDMLMMTIDENLHRRDLNPIEEARGMQMLCEAGCKDEKIAEIYDITIDTVRRRLNLLKLPLEIQRMITRHIFPLPVHQALMLLNLSESQQLQLARQIAPTTEPPLGEAEVRKLIDALKGPKLGLQESAEDETMPADKEEKEERKTGEHKTPPAPKKEDSEKDALKEQQLGEINMDITGKAKISALGENLIFEDCTTFMKIGKHEITIKEPLTIFLDRKGTAKSIIDKIKAAKNKK